MNNQKKKNILRDLTFILAVAVLLFGCNLNNDLSGTASKGPIDGATVTIYALNSDGSRGSVLGSTTTDSTGNYIINIDYSDPVVLVVTGGSYIDEATGDTVTLGNSDELETFLVSIQTAGDVAITALTTIAAERAAENASGGLAAAITSAYSEVATAFGLDGMDITAVIPSDLTGSSSGDSDYAKEYGLVQSGLSQLVEDDAAMTAQDLLALIKEFAADFSDGDFDGVNADGDTLTFTGTSPKDALNGLSTAMTTFLDSPENLSGFDSTNFTIPAVPTIP